MAAKTPELPTPDCPAEWVPIRSLKLFPGNPKVGDMETIRRSIRANGIYRPVYVQKSTRYVMAGNHTWEAAKAEGHEGIWAWVLDVDDEAAKRINLVDNRAAELGGYNEERLLEMLGSLPSLEGTGWTSSDMDRMLGSLPSPDPGDVPSGVPDDDYKTQLGVIAVCETPAQQQQVFEQLQELIAETPEWEGVELKVVAV